MHGLAVMQTISNSTTIKNTDKKISWLDLGNLVTFIQESLGST